MASYHLSYKEPNHEQNKDLAYKSSIVKYPPLQIDLQLDNNEKMK